MLLLLLASGLVQAGFSLALSLAALSSWALNMATGGLAQWCCCGCQARPKGCPTAAGGQVLCNFNLWAACGARAAAYEALFVQRRAAAKALFCKSH